MILESVRIRRETDRILSPAWILAPFTSTIIAFVTMPAMTTGMVALGLTTIILGYIVGLILWIFVVYQLIKRRTKHFLRDAGLREGILGYLKGIAAKREHQISTELASMTVIHSEAMGEEREKSPVLWTILTFLVPFVTIYVWYFLTKDFPKHDRRQMEFMRQAQSAATKLGITLVVPSWKALPERSFFLYLILTFITAGFFGIYWFYVLIKDPNDHFMAEWQFEDGLVSSIQ